MPLSSQTVLKHTLTDTIHPQYSTGNLNLPEMRLQKLSEAITSAREAGTTWR